MLLGLNMTKFRLVRGVHFLYRANSTFDWAVLLDSFFLDSFRAVDDADLQGRAADRQNITVVGGDRHGILARCYVAAACAETKAIAVAARRCWPQPPSRGASGFDDRHDLALGDDIVDGNKEGFQPAGGG